MYCLPFTTKTGAKHPIFKAPAPHNTCRSCWLCIRYLTDCGLVFECVTSFHCLLTPFSFKGQKLFKPYLKKYTWLVYNRDDNLCIAKSVQKLRDWARSCRAEISIKILHSRSVHMLVFKNNSWPTCVYMIKYNTNRGDIFLIKIQWTKTELLIWYWVYMLFFPKDTGHMHKDLGVVWLYSSQDSLHLFSRWVTALGALRPSVKSKRSSFLRVYSHDSWLKNSRKMENNIIFAEFWIIFIKKEI